MIGWNLIRISNLQEQYALKSIKSLEKLKNADIEEYGGLK